MASVCSLLLQPEFGGLSIWAYFSMKHKTPRVLLCGVCLILNVYEVKSFFSFIFIRNICYISFVNDCFSYLAFKIITGVLVDLHICVSFGCTADEPVTHTRVSTMS